MNPRGRSGLLCASCCLLAGAAAPGAPVDVAISEIHYHPFGVGTDPRGEFVELHNFGWSPVDLGGWSFAEGISFRFPAGTILDPDGYLVVASSTDAILADHPEAFVLGDYGGRLDNDGEVIVLQDSSGRTISRVHYRDGGGWSERADGSGPSLELLQPAGDIDHPTHWAPSRAFGGTPGAPNTRDPSEFPYTGGDGPLLRINEAYRDPGDFGETGSFIELWNGDSTERDLTGYSITEDSTGAGIGFLPDARIPPGGFLAVDDKGLVPAQGGCRLFLVSSDGRTILDALEVPRTAAPSPPHGGGEESDGPSV